MTSDKTMARRHPTSWTARRPIEVCTLRTSSGAAAIGGSHGIGATHQPPAVAFPASKRTGWGWSGAATSDGGLVRSRYAEVAGWV
ncbi:MAG: hypothetical protein ACRCYU_03000 [Nocardioides sp.]